MQIVNYKLSTDKKKVRTNQIRTFTAEREGFEPPVPFSTTVFKTAAFDHSAISPTPPLMFMFRDPAGDRTLDPQIKSLLLYQLSY